MAALPEGSSFLILILLPILTEEGGERLRLGLRLRGEPKNMKSFSTTNRPSLFAGVTRGGG